MLLGCKSSLSRCFWSPSGFCLLLCDLKTTLYCYIRLYPIYAVILRMVFDCSIRNLFSWALAPLPGYLLDIINKGRSQYSMLLYIITLLFKGSLFLGAGARGATLHRMLAGYPRKRRPLPLSFPSPLMWSWSLYEVALVGSGSQIGISITLTSASTFSSLLRIWLSIIFQWQLPNQTLFDTLKFGVLC